MVKPDTAFLHETPVLAYIHRCWGIPDTILADEGWQHTATAGPLAAHSLLPGAALHQAALPISTQGRGWHRLKAVCQPTLAVQERELCAQTRLLPVHYLELKALMMREGQTKGYISRQEARSFFRLEPAKAVRCTPQHHCIRRTSAFAALSSAIVI